MALDLCDRTIVLHRGEITADGSTHALFQDEVLLTRSGLEKPLKMQGCPICGEKGEKHNLRLLSAPAEAKVNRVSLKMDGLGAGT